MFWDKKINTELGADWMKYVQNVSSLNSIKSDKIHLSESTFNKYFHQAFPAYVHFAK